MPDTRNKSETPSRTLGDEMEYISSIREIINGSKKADLIINNVNIVDVFSEKILEDSSIAIWGNRIVAINVEERITAERYFDAKGFYAIPGLIDAHLHIESQLGTAAAMAEGLVPHGTTSVIGETLDLVSAAGLEGKKALIGYFKDAEKLPYRNYVFAGTKKVSFEVLSDLLDWEYVIGLGEANHVLVNGGDEEEQKKIALGRIKGMMLSGHIDPSEHMNQVDLYANLGILNDHSHSSYEDLLHTLSCGIYIQLSELLGALDEYIPQLLRDGVSLDHVSLAYDNCWIDKMISEGHMDTLVQKAIDLGVSPIKAIKMASINTANCFGLQNEIGSIAPGRFADIVLTPSINEIRATHVFKGGDLVASNQKLSWTGGIDYSDICRKTMRGLSDLQLEDLAIKPYNNTEDAGKELVDVFDLCAKNSDFHRKEWLQKCDGNTETRLYDGRVLTPISIIQRFPEPGSQRHIINGFVTDYVLREGATAEIYPSPQWYITVIGNRLEERYFAAKKIDEMTGGYLISYNQKVLAALELPIYGWVSDLGAEEIMSSLDKLEKHGEARGYQPPSYSRNETRWFEIQRNLIFQLDRYGCLKVGNKDPWVD
jgi:adenine deaminase